MKLNSNCSFVAAALIITTTLLGVSPATNPAAPDHAPALSARIVVRMDPSAMNPLAIATTDVDDALRAFFRSHETFSLDELQALEITGEQGARVPLSKVAKVGVKFERLATTRPAARK